MIRLASSGALILCWLAACTNTSAPDIGTACAMAPGETRSGLAALESRRFVSSRSDKDSKLPRRVYFVTSEGKRAVGIIDAKSPV